MTVLYPDQCYIEVFYKGLLCTRANLFAMFDVCKKEIKEMTKFPFFFIILHMYHLNPQPTLLHFQCQNLMFENQLTLFLILKTPLPLHVRSTIYVLFEYTSNSSTFPVPEPYVREPTDFIPDSEDTSAATSREVTQANISQNNGTAEETKTQQRPKVVSLVCRAHEGQLSAAPYSIKPTQLVIIKYLILMHLIL